MTSTQLNIATSELAIRREEPLVKPKKSSQSFIYALLSAKTFLGSDEPQNKPQITNPPQCDNALYLGIPALNINPPKPASDIPLANKAKRRQKQQ